MKKKPGTGNVAKTKPGTGNVAETKPEKGEWCALLIFIVNALIEARRRERLFVIAIARERKAKSNDKPNQMDSFSKTENGNKTAILAKKKGEGEEKERR